MSGFALSFGTVADRYARSRPTYAEPAVRFVLPRVPCRVADVGAGTGKLTAVLLELGCAVVAVEPDDAMRARIVGAEAVAGTAELLPLPDASVDAVVAGQAFHWFDSGRFLAEARRVLRPGGTVGVLWNQLDDSVPWVAELADRIEAVDRTTGSPTGVAPFVDPGFEPAESLLARHAERLDRGLLVDLVASRSRTIALRAAERERLLAAVRDLPPADEFALPYVTNAWRAALRS